MPSGAGTHLRPDQRKIKYYYRQRSSSSEGYDYRRNYDRRDHRDDRKRNTRNIEHSNYHRYY